MLLYADHHRIHLNGRSRFREAGRIKKWCDEKGAEIKMTTEACSIVVWFTNRGDTVLCYLGTINK